MQICLRIPKMSFIVMYDNQKCERNAFQKCDVIIFTCFFFFDHCTGWNKDIAVKFCMCVVCMHLDHIYSVFFNSPRFWKYLRKSNNFIEKSQHLEVFRFWKFRGNRFLCQPFYVYHPILESLGSSIFFSISSINAFLAENGQTWPQVDLHKSWPKLT